MPAYWEAKYFSLLPKETRELAVTFDDQNLNGEDPYLILEAWNIEPVEFSLVQNKDVTPDYTYSKPEAPKSIKKGEGFTIQVSVKSSAESGSGLLKSYPS